MKNLTVSIVFITVAITMAFLYEYVGPFGLIAILIAAAIMNIYERN